MRNGKTLVAAYFNSQITAAEEEVRTLQTRVRMRRIDFNDCYELQLALIRHETLLQVCKDVSYFLSIEDKIER